MGNCLSVAQGDETRSGVPYAPSGADYVPSHIQPPTYQIDHNHSCRILKRWELDGEKSRGYRYVVYVNNNNLLNKRQQKAQDLILEAVQQYAAIQGLTIWVKCLDYLAGDGSDADAEKEKRFLKELLATDSKSDLIRKWDTRPEGVFNTVRPEEGQQPVPCLPVPNEEDRSQPRKKTLKSSEQEIVAVIEKIRNNKGLDDADAKARSSPSLFVRYLNSTEGGSSTSSWQARP
jgi:hypothetical protein